MCQVITAHFRAQSLPENATFFFFDLFNVKEYHDLEIYIMDHLGLLCHRCKGLELATRQSTRSGAQQQQLQTIAKDKSISLLPLSTHSAVEMLHDSALYKSITHTDIDIRSHWTWHHLIDFIPVPICLPLQPYLALFLR